MMTYKGGNGLDSKEAIIIVGAKDELEGIDGEYIWLEEKYGEQDFSWELIDQQSIDEGDKKYDILKIKFLNGEEREYWFDITDFYGK
jgi:hypothetical protein